MSESLIAYLLHGVLKALEYLHQMGYVHRWVGRRGWVEMEEVQRCTTGRQLDLPSVNNLITKHVVSHFEGLTDDLYILV